MDMPSCLIRPRQMGAAVRQLCRWRQSRVLWEEAMDQIACAKCSQTPFAMSMLFMRQQSTITLLRPRVVAMPRPDLGIVKSYDPCVQFEQ
jgi:hypothetical protein